MLLAGAAVSGLGVSVTNAGLLIDVRAFSKNGVSTGINAKSVAVNPGDTVIFRVFADVTGAAGNSLPEAIQSLSGSFLSTGGIKGDLLVTPTGITPPFADTGSTPGSQSDLDGDGDLDVGSNTDGDPAGFFIARSAQLRGPRSTDTFGSPVYTQAGSAPTAITDGTEYRIVTTMRMIVSSVGANTNVNFRKRTSSTFGFWSQDATENSTDNQDGTTAYSYTGGQSFTDSGTVSSGSPVLLTSVPEPATVGLAALAGLGMLARRRK